jgi:uncharacterized protein YndB with AHSA1/START domain
MNMKTTIDRTTFTITFQREFDASPEDVFDAWTDPEQIKYWWDPTGTPLSECVIELRVGGSFKFTNASGHAPPFAGVYRRVDRPSWLEFEAMGSLGTVSLEASATATHMTVNIRCASAEHLEQFLKLGVDTGTDRTLDNLVAYVARKRKAG